MTESSRITDLLKITSRLIGVLQRENEMLRAMKPSDIQDLQQDKIVLTAAYESQVKSLKDHPELLDNVTPELRAELKTVIGTFEQTLTENERALRAAKYMTERVLKAIADEVEKKRLENASYTANGQVEWSSSAGGRQPISVAVDQRL